MDIADKTMQCTFESSAAAILRSYKEHRAGELVVGIETEVSVVRRKDLEPVTQETRDAIIAALGGRGDVELGAFQLELRTPPLDVRADGLLGVCASLRDTELQARRAAAASGATIVRHGFYPIPIDIKRIECTKTRKYEVVPAFHDERRGRFVNTSVGRVEPVDIGHAKVIALANSVQFNLQVSNAREAVALTNRLLSVSPLLCAVASNARYLAGRDLGLADARMLVWERSHDTRDIISYLADAPTRVGLPASYYESIEDYFSRVASFPFILDAVDAALQVGIGLYWNDVRIKFPNGRFVVEFRPLSVQPTAIEDVALLAALLGLSAAPEERVPLRPMSLLVRDRQAAFDRGLDAHLHMWDGHRWTPAPARDVVAAALGVAREGLQSLGLTSDAAAFLSVLEKRLSQGTPSERFGREVDELRKQGFTMLEALRTALGNHCTVGDEE